MLATENMEWKYIRAIISVSLGQVTFIKERLWRLYYTAEPEESAWKWGRFVASGE